MRPRISLATLSAVIAVFAVDFVIWRDQCYTLLPPVDSTEPFLWTVLPLLSALAVGGLSLAVQVVRRGEGRPFLLGFEMVGGLVVIALVALHWAQSSRVEAPLRATKDGVDFVLRRVGLVDGIHTYYTPFWHDFATPILVGGIISMPPLFLAWLGGWWFRKHGVAIVRSQPQSREPGDQSADVAVPR